ncbi:kinase-like domain-containing protein [Gigaspora margarita]|uniref:Kinase-like domain-containing protein n=1 Tax=Gigaspora margarita TaxID=4874 RepID=A0A8H4AQ03_GIGMA|nr:kinase-like domain-containing protein [Gigaspora margarita]
MGATGNKFQQLQKYIIEKNVTCYDHTRFKIVELIKNEEFTRVYRAVFKNKITVILKSFENNDLTINEVINELKLYRGVDIHPNIIRFNGVTRQEGDPSIIPYMLIYEDVNGGTLRSYLHENSQHLSWNDMIKFSLQIANAVKYLHAKGIINLGLHLENIFMHNNNIKLADYGLSNRLKRQAVKYQDLGLDKKSDIYTVGILMQEMYNNILFAKNVVSPMDKYIKIYKDCLCNEPNSRPEIQFIVSNLKSLIVNCNQNINSHDLVITHPQNSFIIQDSIRYNSILLQESPAHVFNIEPNHTLESPTDLNNLLEIEPNNANFLS